ncbi:MULTISPECIES: BglG family transcription antiterminator [unclassified Enterococcus]|uniref:BglG family transcription antiterminator n=1 Tax=unclassified Enterococcus TaxID=2608891 RepID=UPI0019076655|nr:MULTISPECIES: PTS sugar transporter subunit IIA [unclassified Enterococcus]MBK0036055.1 transcription antiterminator [Enterococcus sp. S52]MBK0068713.1 transcription antiterminator [Enterococcus sp. S53]MBK0139306.1 transcription antiterminator [Enterococcus sp. S76]MBK0142941.1 transcription antiterminator [Enterococcus sp. S77]
MKENLTNLILYLIKAEEVTNSKVLSSYLNVSTRTIRNYIQEINSFYSSKIIDSTKNGYIIADKDKARYLLNQTIEKNERMLPQTEDERIDFILSKFLKSILEINLFDLSEELAISYATLKKTIKNTNYFLEEFNLYLSSKESELILIGTEQNKRALMRYYLYNNSTENILSIKYLENFFGRNTIQTILAFFEQINEKFGLQMNDFSLRNVLLHLAIIASRNKEGEYLSDSEIVEFGLDDPVITVIKLEKFIYEFFLEKFDIDLATSELHQISILIQTNSNELNANKLIDNGILNEIEDILNQLKNYYYFPINYKSFVIPFSIHLKGLYKRIEIKKFNKNPLLKDIKISSPILYDIALFIADIINKKLSTKIPEDEIGYIALHLGNAINKDKINMEKVNVVLILPDYLNYSENIFESLKEDFASDLNIIAVVQDSSKLNMFDNIQLIISISKIDIKAFDNIRNIIISPFYSEKDQNQIRETIIRIRKNTERRFMKINLERFLNEELFFLNIDYKDKYDIIYAMSKKMREFRYVTDTFNEEVITREKMSSTAFREIAIPHSIVMNAPKTMVSICINPYGIDWGNQRVKLVLLISVSKKDNTVFRKMYENLVDTLSETNNLEQVIYSKRFSEFKESILSLWN